MSLRARGRRQWPLYWVVRVLGGGGRNPSAVRISGVRGSTNRVSNLSTMDEVHEEGDAGAPRRYDDTTSKFQEDKLVLAHFRSPSRRQIKRPRTGEK